MNLSVYEMLESVEKQDTKQKKIDMLRSYSNVQALMTVLELALDEGWVWLLPETNPPYNPTPREADVQQVLKADYRRLQYLVNTPEGLQVKPMRREMMFIEMLESVDPSDEKLLVAAKNKKLPFKSITKKLVMETFPEGTEGWK
jgi:hypothetical protein